MVGALPGTLVVASQSSMLYADANGPRLSSVHQHKGELGIVVSSFYDSALVIFPGGMGWAQLAWLTCIT